MDPSERFSAGAADVIRLIADPQRLAVLGRIALAPATLGELGALRDELATRLGMCPGSS